MLLAYATGALPEGFNLVIANHVSLCDDCRAPSGEFVAIGGALIGQNQSVDMTEGSLADALARLNGPAPAQAPTQRGGIFPTPLQDSVGGDLDAVRLWSIGMGIKQAILPTSDEASARLLLIPAGGSMSHHSHGGTELSLVLQGAFRDEDGRFARRDFKVAGG